MSLEKPSSPKAASKASAETYPQTAALRNNQEAIEQNAAKSMEYFDTHVEKGLEQMFGPRSQEGGRNADLTTEELADVRNFLQFAAKRLAAGAVSSRMFHEQIEKGKTKKALHELAPVSNIAHDAMHSMVAYVRTQGMSLVPAYTQLENEKDLVWVNAEANVEESYANFFMLLDEMTRTMQMMRRTQGLRGEALAQAALEEWERKQPELYRVKNLDPEFYKQHRIPEFETSVRNLAANLEREHPDPNFAVHEFQRMLAPLLERLRTSEEKGKDSVPENANQAAMAEADSRVRLLDKVRARLGLKKSS